MVRKFRFGLIGGGEGSFIGQVHRMAAELDGMAELVCGAFASDPERSKRSGQSLYRLPETRCYGTFDEMLLALKTGGYAVFSTASAYLYVINFN